MRYTMYLVRFRVDGNYKYIGNPILTIQHANTIGEIMRIYRALKNCNDVTKYSPYILDNIIDNSEWEA